MSSSLVRSLEGGIRFEEVCKGYRRDRGGVSSLRGRLFGGPGSRRVSDVVTAIHGVSFDALRGTSTGLIGGNGAGKSTLLRLAAGLSRPTRGRIAVPRDTVSVLRLGENFDGNLSGRENATTALIVNGLGRGEARARLADAVAFAELEDDVVASPVRTYSAGMILRLAFGVAAQLHADAFLIDEVLAVGDLRFQEKCAAHLTGLRDGGATILLASHDLLQVRRLCDRVVWLERGRVRLAGTVDEVVDAYEDDMRSATLAATPVGAGAGDEPLELGRNRFGSQEAALGEVRLNGCPSGRIASGAPLRLEATVTAGSPREAIVGVTIRRAADAAEAVNEHAPLGVVAGSQRVALEIGRLDLAPGAYLVDVGVYAPDWTYAYDFHWGAYQLEVTGVAGTMALLRPPVRWAVDVAAEAPPPRRRDARN